MKLNQSDHSDNIPQEFIQHLKTDSDMEELSLSTQNDIWYKIVRKNRYHDKRVVRLLIWSGSVAATICILLVTTLFKLSSPQPSKVDYVSVMKSFEYVDHSADNVQLVLSNNQKIAIEGKETQLHYDEEGWVNINKKKKMTVNENTHDEQEEFNQLIVPHGKRSKLTLNDGTQIWINSGSKLVYPSFFGQHKREIYIEGEIFVDVRPDPKRPFIVHTSTLDVKVLGTQFNVSSCSYQSDLQIVLARGEVEIQQNGHSKEILKPNQKFSYNEKTQESSTSIVDVTEYIAWKDGYYTFKHQDLGAVLSKLSLYYNVQFRWSENIRGLSCSGKLDLKEDLFEVLRMLEKTAPIKIQKISEREFTVKVQH